MIKYFLIYKCCLSFLNPVVLCLFVCQPTEEFPLELTLLIVSLSCCQSHFFSLSGIRSFQVRTAPPPKNITHLQSLKRHKAPFH